MDKHNWLCENFKKRKKYKGEYIAIGENGIISHSKDLLKVIKEAKKINDNPLISYEPKGDVLIL